MALIPGSLPSDTCYGTPQELLELFAQYLDIPAFAVSSKVLYSGTSPYPNTDFVWIDISGTDTPILKLYNEVTGTYENYPFSGQTSPTGSEKLISTKVDATTPLTGSEYVLVAQNGILKKVTSSNILPSSGSITYPMLSTSATEANNVAKRTAKTWVNFNGIGTVTIRDDFNVSTVADNGVGDYTINFSAALSSSSYCVTGCATHDNGSYTSAVLIDRDNSGMQAGSCRINLINFSSVLVDAEFVCVAMFL
jgi:hypothetical protein